MKALSVEDVKSNLLHAIEEAGLRVNHAQIDKAVEFAFEAHKMQTRASGEPFIIHPLEVAKLIIELKIDTISIIVALLHDVVEDTKYTIDDIQKHFGSKIAELVDGVTKLTKLGRTATNYEQAENLRKLFLAMSKDVRVLLIKLSDRLHNMRTLLFIRDPKQRARIAFETLRVYAALADRIGLQKFKNELEDIAFAELHQEVRDSILQRLNFLRESGHIQIAETISEIQTLLVANGIDAKITGREKTPHSIWNKMETRGISFAQLSDIVAFRIIVKSVGECYSALGVIHSKYHMIPGGFKDYISTSKVNGYRSLHSVVVGPGKKKLEIQIRTQEMHETAELGIAAHWAYKHGISSNDAESFIYNSWLNSLRVILEQEINLEDNIQELLGNQNLEINSIFCFTPNGDLIALPQNATPLDFAFAVHSKIGLSCVGAKINNRVAPLNAALENGDQVEILRSSTFSDSIAMWKDSVVTSKAKSEINKIIKNREQEEFIKLGKAILNKKLHQQKLVYNEDKILLTLNTFKKTSLKCLFSSIGSGTLSCSDVLKAAYPSFAPNRFVHIITKRIPFLNIRNKSDEPPECGVDINSMSEGTTIHLQPCCSPLPGDKIAGILTTGKGLYVHTTDCHYMSKAKKERAELIDLVWSCSRTNVYVAKLQLLMLNIVGSLNSVTQTISARKINIFNIRITNRTLDSLEVLLDLEVKGIQQLQSIIDSIKILEHIYSVKRFKE